MGRFWSTECLHKQDSRLPSNEACSLGSLARLTCLPSVLPDIWNTCFPLVPISTLKVSAYFFLTDLFVVQNMSKV